MAHPKRWTPVRRAAIRFVLWLGVLLALSPIYGKFLTQALLPVFRWEIAHLDETYRVLDLRLAQQGADTVVRLDAGLARIILVGGQVLYPDPLARATVSTLAGAVTQPAMLCLALILAWPARRAIEYPVRAGIACAGIALVILADVPFVLWGELWDIHVSAFEPDRFSPLLMWRGFLQGGGRFVLGLAVGVLAVGVGQALTARSRETARL